MATIKDSLIEQAQANLAHIETLTASAPGGILGTVGSTMTKYQAELQAMLDRLLKEKGIITDSQYNDYYETLRRTSKESIQKGFVRQNILFSVLLVGIIAGIFYVIRKK